MLQNLGVHFITVFAPITIQLRKFLLSQNITTKVILRSCTILKKTKKPDFERLKPF